MTHNNRGKIILSPLPPVDSPFGHWHKTLTYPGSRLEPLAYIVDHAGSERPIGILARIKNNGNLVNWFQGVTRSIDPRKAEAALADLATNDENTADIGAELAQICKNWRQKAELTQSRAAIMLDLPLKTYEHIEMGRGFRYPRLLTLAIMAFD